MTEGMGFFPEPNPPPPIERFVAPEEAMIDERNNEIDILRAALVFYASTAVYLTLPEDLGCPPIMRDGGAVARQVLGWE